MSEIRVLPVPPSSSSSSSSYTTDIANVQKIDGVAPSSIKRHIEPLATINLGSSNQVQLFGKLTYTGLLFPVWQVCDALEISHEEATRILHQYGPDEWVSQVLLPELICYGKGKSKFTVKTVQPYSCLTVPGLKRFICHTNSQTSTMWNKLFFAIERLCRKRHMKSKYQQKKRA
jgi:hypothetical protein